MVPGRQVRQASRSREGSGREDDVDSLPPPETGPALRRSRINFSRASRSRLDHRTVSTVNAAGCQSAASDSVKGQLWVRSTNSQKFSDLQPLSPHAMPLGPCFCFSTTHCRSRIVALSSNSFEVPTPTTSCLPTRWGPLGSVDQLPCQSSCKKSTSVCGELPLSMRSDQDCDGEKKEAQSEVPTLLRRVFNLLNISSQPGLLVSSAHCRSD